MLAETVVQKWLLATPPQVAMVLISSVCTYAAILVYTRIVGLRSLSKMSAADFAMTVAVGSLFASTIATSSPPLLLGLIAIASLYAGQWLIAWLRYRVPGLQNRIDNSPLLLMSRGQFNEDNLRRASVTKQDVYSKLRECNALDMDRVHAVIFESTGDVSVLHGDPDQTVAPELYEGVIGT